MDKALAEIARVLKPGGIGYISEPIYAGEFNDILRMFHDEKSVRQAALDALQRAVADETLELKEELFFYAPVVFENFEQFADRVMGVTHSHFQLTDELIAQVEAKFDQTVKTNEGLFRQPIRVDLLQKPL
jgi:SAM-dependent methyltransferase